MKQTKINVLIACEESQAECIAFREAGFNAFSCDIQSCRPKGHPEWHIKGDVTPLLYGKKYFRTQDGKVRHVSRWHMIIAHPPCTYLCKVGALWLFKNTDWHIIEDDEVINVNYNRWLKLKDARRFFMQCLNADADFVAVENPIPMKRAHLPPPSCYVEPYWYGHKYSKKTLYWLRNLPPLLPGIVNPHYKCYVTSSRGKYRSRTFSGVAKAMAEQWGAHVKRELSNI